MKRTQQIDEQLESLAAYLATRREVILGAWRAAVDRDPQMTTGASLPRTLLNDHIPDLLEAFGRKLCVATEDQRAEHEEEHKEDAAAHGLQRWQQGYDLREVTREWGRLQLCVADELERYAAAHTELLPDVMPVARRTWAEICTDGVSESASEYFRLRQIEAEGNVRDLEKALTQMDGLERRRAELWREAAHDLRGNLGVVVNVTAGLSMRSASDGSRDEFVRMLGKNVSALHSLLEDVTNLARLQAGHEERHVQPMDAAVVLQDLCARTRSLAEDKRLYLRAEGPATLGVEGDAIKVERIAQNLLFNAIKYTPSGGVTLSWGESRKNDDNRWMLSVQDTGPGFHAGPGAPIAGALEEATDEAREVEHPADATEDAATAGPTVSESFDTHDRRPIQQERGEGIGLSIVKRLCELLDATVEVESTPDEGTTFRVLFPRRYTTTEAGS